MSLFSPCSKISPSATVCTFLPSSGTASSIRGILKAVSARDQLCCAGVGNTSCTALLGDGRLSREVTSPSKTQHLMCLDLVSYRKICTAPKIPGQLPAPVAAGAGRPGQRCCRLPMARAGSHSPAFIKKIGVTTAESRAGSLRGACQAPGLFDLRVLIHDGFCSLLVFPFAVFCLAVKLIFCHGVNGCVNSDGNREGKGTGAR